MKKFLSILFGLVLCVSVQAQFSQSIAFKAAAAQKPAVGGGGGGGCTPSYFNTGGIGDRQTIITVTGDFFTTATHKTIDGDTSSNGQFFFPGGAVAGKRIIWDFLAGNSVLLGKTKFFSGGASTAQGVWKWQGSNDGTSWTDAGGTFTLSGSSSGDEESSMVGFNTTSYRYYSLLGVSGNCDSGPWCFEWQWEICGLP